MQQLVVIGAGVIGLSCAWQAAAARWSVTLVDPDPSRGASWVAGGMLAPVTEAWPGEEELLELGLDSLRRWPRFAADLAAAAGRDPGLRTEGTVVAATGAGDRAELGSLAAFLAGLGRDVDQLTGRELRRLEPALGPELRGGLSVPGDLAVDNRALLAALRTACDRPGVRVVPRQVAAISEDGARVTGVRFGEPDPAVDEAGRRPTPLSPSPKPPTSRPTPCSSAPEPTPGGCTRTWPGSSDRSRGRSSGWRTAAVRCRRRRGPSARSSTADPSTPCRATAAASSSARRSTRPGSTST